MVSGRLYRYDPRTSRTGEHPFHLDSHKPKLRFRDFAMQEGRFAMLTRSNPQHAERLLRLAQQDIDDRWHFYEQMAGVERDIFETSAPVEELAQNLSFKYSNLPTTMNVDLSTRYLGLALKNPLGASASPLTRNLDTLRRLEDAGASVAVLPSLFEEQIRHEEEELQRLFEYQAESYAESLSYFPEFEDYNTGPNEYSGFVEAAKRAVSIPIIGSLNGCSDGGWIRYAHGIERAGADGLELNIYFVPTDPQMTAAQVEQRYVNIVSEVCRSVSIPVAVKIGPHFTSLPHFANRLIAAGASGLVLFNRYLEADINLETLQFQPDLVLSNRHEARSPDPLDCDFARSNSRVAGGHQRHPPRGRHREAAVSRSRRHVDGEHPDHERPRRPANALGRTGQLVGGARIRLRRATQREHESPQLPRCQR